MSLWAKIRKVRCPKGRSTALFACQKSLLGHFLAFVWHVFFFLAFSFFKSFLLKKYLKSIFDKQKVRLSVPSGI